jgi:hypothetical protein
MKEGNTKHGTRNIEQMNTELMKEGNIEHGTRNIEL